MKTLPSSLWAAVAATLLVAPLAAVDIVVDNEAGAPSYTETGSWLTSSNTTAGYNGGGYRFTRSTSPASVATWRPTVPTTGFYEVTVYFRRAGDRTSAAPYTVTHADGVANMVVDQTGAFSGDLGEVSLGIFRFEAGTTGTVKLANVAGGNVVFIADAIKLASDPPPEITGQRHAPLYPAGDASVLTFARLTDAGGVASATVAWSAAPSGASGSVDAFDDGAHGDGTAGDGIWGATLPGQPAGQTVTYAFNATDNQGQTTNGATSQYVVGYAPSYSLKINEVLTSNGGVALDEDFGESGDWVELYNSGPDAADLSYHTLSDDAGTPTKWAFPLGASVPAGGYLLVWCDDYDTIGNELHTNFRLSAGGETVVLYNDATDTAVDQVAVPPLPTNESYSRIPDATGPFANTLIATPLAANVLGARGATPTFSHASGLYGGPINVTITAPGATEVRYTLDGSEPALTSTLYTTPVAVSTTTGLRARAWYPSVNPSLIGTASYLYVNEPDRTIPVMNLVIDPKHLFDPTTGIYTNFNARGDAWERPGHAMFMNPDGTQVHETGVGVRINGGTSRGAAKKSLRLYLRPSYGAPEWSLPWLERTSAPAFDQLVLRSNNNDGILNASGSELNQVTFFRDELLRDLHGRTGAVSVDGFFFALYINGQYWGLYNACERVKADYMQAKLGGADWDVVKGTWNSTLKYNTEVLDGDLVEWNAFLAWLDANDVSTPAGLDALKQRIDYTGFLEYFALNIAAQNHDWPQNNWIATRRRGDPTARWSFHQNDGEWGLGLRPSGSTSDTIVWAQGSNYMTSPGHNNRIAPLSKLFNGNDVDPQFVFPINGILDNPQGRADFIAAMEEILNFEMSPATGNAAVDSYKAKIQTEVPRESARWAANMVVSPATFNAAWPNAVNTMKTFFNNRPATIRSQMQSKFAIAGTRTITFQKAGAGNGRVQVYGRTVDLPWTGVFFDARTLDLAAIAEPGSAFVSWSGATSGTAPETDLAVTTGAATSVTLTFTLSDPDYDPNDVIINEYWVNDNATTYPSVYNKAIDGDWIELLVVRDAVDLRGWRLTNNLSATQQGTIDDGDGSLILPSVASLANVPQGTIVLIVSSINATNAASFPVDDLDPTDRRLILYRGNNNLDDDTDPGFGVGTSNQHLVLLAPGATASFVDDVGVDFIAEGATVTPVSFFGVPAPTVSFVNPFAGIGGDDGAVFTNDGLGGFSNDDGLDPNNSDALAGAGGWIVDPPAASSGDAAGVNILTPGAKNWNQNLNALLPPASDRLLAY